jgi:hypothetical protein
MRHGWHRRARTQQNIPSPPRPTTERREWIREPIDGRYLSSTRAGDWLDRIVVHSMGVPSRATLGIASDGVQIDRPAERDIFIPLGSLIGARLDRALAGKVYQLEGIVVITWWLGDAEVDTGFRATSTDVQQELVATIETMTSAAATEGKR